MSVYLEAADTPSQPPGGFGWSRRVDLISFTLNSGSEKKQRLQSITGTGKRSLHTFNAAATEWGFAKFITLADLNDPTKGYIVDDTIVIISDIVVAGPNEAESAAASAAAAAAATPPPSPSPPRRPDNIP
jgi:hypothetical protein